MAPVTTSKRRRQDDEVRRPKKKIRVRKQAKYHSSSDEEDEHVVSGVRPVTLTGSNAVPRSILKQRTSLPLQEHDGSKASSENEQDGDELDRNTALNAIPPDGIDEDEDEEEVGVEETDADDVSVSDDADEDDDEDAESESASLTSSQAAAAKKKRNDPSAFATSISRILSTKLTTSKRADPVLSRSQTASDANKAISDEKLEQAARKQIRAERKQALEKGRVKDVLGVAEDAGSVDTGAVLIEERRLKKTAQRGVVKLFNAVRAAQVKAEEGMRQVGEQGVVGMGKREERVNEMSKQGFLDLISSGGRKDATAAAS